MHKTQKMVELGGKRWMQNGKDRIYFNFELFEGCASFYKTKSFNDLAAVLHRPIPSPYESFYYDVNKEEYVSSIGVPEETHYQIVNEIERKIGEL
jgi:hypothetical protein